LSRDRLLLHDGIIRRASYIARTLFLPGPQHIPLVALPQFLSFAYIPLGLAHDLVALPIYRAYERLIAQIDRSATTSRIVRALAPISAETRKKMKRLHLAYSNAQRELADEPQNFIRWVAVGDVLSAMKRYKEAISFYDRAL
jgi:thioredoxin-like negative regulator of GroEL